MLDKTRELTLRVILRVIFGVNESAELTGPLKGLLAYGASEQVVYRYLARRWGAVRHWRGLNRTLTRAHHELQRLIDDRRTQPDLADRTDILSLLLAGHEATATTMAWLFDLLTHHPDALARVRAEAENGETQYTDAVINEVLRVRPVVVGTARVTAEAFTLGPWRLPPDTWILPYIRGTNHRPVSYPDPGTFQPDRFLDHQPNAYAWIPFGGGIKRCLGAAFARTELRVVTHTLLRRGTFQPASATPDTMRRAGPILEPRHRVPLILTSRT